MTTLERITAELSEIDGVRSVVTPLTSLTYSSELVSGPAGTQALTGALGRDEAGAAARSADVQISLARRGAVADQFIGNPAWNDLLIYGNDVDAGGETVFPSLDLAIRARAGRGLVFNPDDDRNLHAGAPVVRGEKYVFITWVHEHEFPG